MVIYRLAAKYDIYNELTSLVLNALLYLHKWVNVALSMGVPSVNSPVAGLLCDDVTRLDRGFCLSLVDALDHSCHLSLQLDNRCVTNITETLLKLPTCIRNL